MLIYNGLKFAPVYLFWFHVCCTLRVTCCALRD